MINTPGHVLSPGWPLCKRSGLTLIEVSQHAYSSYQASSLPFIFYHVILATWCNWLDFYWCWIKFCLSLSLSLCDTFQSWWRHQMETFSALVALCSGDSPVTGESPAQRPEARSFDVFFDLRLNKQLWGRSFETPSRSLWRHCNVKWHPPRHWLFLCITCW